MINKKTMASIALKAEEAVSATITEAGYSVWDVEFLNEGGAYNLLITIDSPDGITLNDCERVTRLINPIIDEIDPCDESYFIEVSSPGAERPLRTDAHLSAYLQKDIIIGLFSPLESHPELKKTLHVTLISFDSGSITVKLKDQNETLVIERKRCSTLKADDFGEFTDL